MNVKFPVSTRSVRNYRCKYDLLPIAEALEVPRVEFNRGASSSIAKFLRENYPEDVILIVGHSETIPKLLRSFGYQDTFPISRSAYGWLFIVTPLEHGPPAVARLNINLRQGEMISYVPKWDRNSFR